MIRAGFLGGGMGTGSGVNPVILALVARMSSNPPSSDRITAMSNLVTAHQVSGVWQTLDMYQRRDAHYAGGCLFDWVDQTRTAALIASPVFTANRNYVTNGVAVTGSAIDSQFIPSTATLSSLNDAAFHVFENRATTSFSIQHGASDTTTTYWSVTGRNSSTQLYSTINRSTAGADTISGVTDNYGLQTAVRRASNQQETYLRGVSIGTNTTASTARPPQTLYTGGYHGAGGGLASASVVTNVMIAYGKALTTAQALAMWDAEEAYLRAIGNWSEPVYGWGDSMTAGAGTGAPPNDYLTQLQPLSFNAGFPYRRTLNGGVSGETSTQIKTRMLAATGYDQRNRAHIIWAGRNNFTSPTTVKADIAAMVAQATAWSGRYLVIQIPPQNDPSEYTGAANRIVLNQLNTDLSALYGSKFVTILGSGKITLDGNGIPDSSFRTDSLHFNATGNGVVATEVQAALVAGGWN